MTNDEIKECYTNKKDLKAGDILISVEPSSKGIQRKITKVRNSGYSWVYPDIPDREFLSENSCDPFFGFGWKKI